MITKRRALAVILALAAVISAPYAKISAGLGEHTIEIVVSDAAGAPLEEVIVGDVIKVSVYLTDFEQLSMTNPSLHFDPAIVQVCSAEGNILSTQYQSKIPFETDKPIGGAWKGALMESDNYYPFVNNGTGVIGFWADSSSYNDLSGRQRIYSVYMKAAAVGDPDIRLSRKSDGAGKENPRSYYDYAMYGGDTPYYVMYGENGHNGEYSVVTPELRVFDAVTVTGGFTYGGGVPANGILLPGETLYIDTEIINRTGAQLKLLIEAYSESGVYEKIYELTSADNIDYNDEYEIPAEDVVRVKLSVTDVQTTEAVIEPLELNIPPAVYKPEVYFKAKVNGAESDKSLIKRDFELEVYLKDARNIVNITLPVISAPDGLAELKSVTAAAGFEILENAQYEADSGNIMVLAEDRSADGGIDMYGAETLLCTLEYTAGTEPGAVTFAFAEETAQSPVGVILYDNENYKGTEGSLPIAPGTEELVFTVWKDKTPPPVGVYVIAQGDEIIVIVTGNEPGASVRLYDKDDTLVEAGAAGEQGNTVFLTDAGSLPENKAYVSAEEEDKYESDKTDGIPADARLVLTEILANDDIRVSRGTSKSSVPFPQIKGKVTAAVSAANKEIEIALPWEYTFEPDGEWTGTYDANPSRTTAYPQEAVPLMYGGIENPDNLTASVNVIVEVSGGGGGSGGGGPAETPKPEEIPEAEPESDNMLNKADHYRYVFGYPDGTIQPQGQITRQEVAAIFYRLLTAEARAENRSTEPGFPDVASDAWSAVSVATMRTSGVIQGYEDGTFRPASSITRAEFAAIAVRFDGLVSGAENRFTDTKGHWAESYISTAVSRGWADGYPDGTFLPNQPITRAEAVKLINRVLERSVDKQGLLPELVAEWSDVGEDYWGYFEIQEATVSHYYERRYPNGEDNVENWTGGRADLDFDE
ncbi:MAG: S-layer homology domain-containing protein [Oscillospiraceae bacterium]|jgi:hypothetical protein|nr:S-layer homology domain-containing protein [Oscillospiraceae bacterium]